MNCEEFAGLLDAYIDGELDAKREKAFLEHAHGCSACARELAAADALRDAMRDLGEVDVPLEAQAAWRGAIRKEAQKGKLRRIRRFASVAAALVVVLGCGILLGSSARRTAVPENTAVISAEESMVYLAMDGASPQEAGEMNFDARTVVCVDDIPAAQSAVEELCQEYGASFEAMAVDGGAGYRITLPAEDRDVFLSAVGALGSVTDELVNELSENEAVIELELREG